MFGKNFMIRSFLLANVFVGAAYAAEYREIIGGGASSSSAKAEGQYTESCETWKKSLKLGFGSHLKSADCGLKQELFSQNQFLYVSEGRFEVEQVERYKLLTDLQLSNYIMNEGNKSLTALEHFVKNCDITKTLASQMLKTKLAYAHCGYPTNLSKDDTVYAAVGTYFIHGDVGPGGVREVVSGLATTLDSVSDIWRTSFRHYNENCRMLKERALRLAGKDSFLVICGVPEMKKKADSSYQLESTSLVYLSNMNTSVEVKHEVVQSSGYETIKEAYQSFWGSKVENGEWQPRNCDKWLDQMSANYGARLVYASCGLPSHVYTSEGYVFRAKGTVFLKP